MRLVVDASVAAEYLLKTSLGRRVAPRLEQSELLAPELLDAEVMAVLRRGVNRRSLPEGRATLALHDLVAWPVRRLSHRLLLDEAWRLRQNATAYDALYLAAARLFEATLLTADGPLSRVPSSGALVENVRD